jgi:hypothetical protein
MNARLFVTALWLAPTAACTAGDSEPVDLPECTPFDAAARPMVAGTFRYDSLVFALGGTITFEQTEQTVRVVDTTYDHHDDRALQGEAPLDGNRLDIVLTPKNGDTDYSARVVLSFDATGDRFCLVSFSDTNDDVGNEGTYTGTR